MDKINEKSQQQISLTFAFMKQTEMLNGPIMLKNFGIPLALFAWYVYEVFGMNEERPRDYESETWSNDYPNVNIPRRKYEYIEPDEAEIMIEDFGQLRFGENKLNCIKIEK